MAMICLSCNNSNRENARFCSKCGSKLTPSNTTTSEGTPTGRLPANTLLAERYLILKKIGQGGMAAVYLASDERLPGKKWAVKEMSESFVTSRLERESIIKDFQRETEILTSLNHPNIPQIIDSFNDSGRYYLVMEYVNGPTLRNLLNNRSEPFSEQEVHDFMTQLCDVLSYIHQHKPPIIFRDLKPDNIMIDERSQIKLIDFGIARLLKPGKSDTKLLGTLGYSAPEQYQGQTDPRSDIYALGVTLHELLTKHDPTSVTPLTPLPTVRKLNPAISKEMEQIIHRSLELNLDKRWQNTSQIKAALTDSLQRKQTPSRPTTKLLLVLKKLSPKQLALLLGGLVGLVILSVWGLAPPIQKNFPALWDNIPTFVMAGPIAYAATRKHWAAMVTHISITIAFWFTLWARMDYLVQAQPLILSAIFSGLVLEGGFHLMPKEQQAAEENWKHEMAWFAGITVGTVISFYLSLNLLAEGYEALHYYAQPGVWLGAAILGGFAWFLGDFIQQWLKMRHITF